MGSGCSKCSQSGARGREMASPGSYESLVLLVTVPVRVHLLSIEHTHTHPHTLSAEPLSSSLAGPSSVSSIFAPADPGLSFLLLSPPYASVTSPTSKIPRSNIRKEKDKFWNGRGGSGSENGVLYYLHQAAEGWEPDRGSSSFCAATQEHRST